MNRHAVVAMPASTRLLTMHLSSATRRLEAAIRRIDTVQLSAHQALQNLAAPVAPHANRVAGLTVGMRVHGSGKDAPTVDFAGWGDFGKEIPKTGFASAAIDVAIGAYRPVSVDGSTPEDGFDALALMATD